MVTNTKRYNFAFTGASMKFHDFMRLAYYIQEHQIDLDEKTPDPNLIMGRSNSRTNKREFRELLKRYKLLTPDQQRLLTEVDIIAQKQLAMIAICKLYTFAQDFIIEVVREKYLVLDFKLTNGNFQSFLNQKIELYPALDDFSESTIKKARQVLWKMLEQGGLIDNTKDLNILPQFISPSIIRVIANDSPRLLKIFLLSEQEISALKV